MTIALVTSLAGFSSNGNGFTTGSVDTTGANFIVLQFYGTVVGTISDSKGNTWIPLTQYSGFFGTRASQIFYSENATTGSGHTFSVTGTSNVPSLLVAAFSGVAASSSFDVENAGTDGNLHGTLATGSVSPAAGNELIITALGAESATGGATIDSGFTVLQTISDTNFGHQWAALAYLIETTATSQNPTWTNSNCAVASIATFKAAAEAAGFVPFARTQIAHGDWDA